MKDDVQKPQKPTVVYRSLFCQEFLSTNHGVKHRYLLFFVYAPKFVRLWAKKAKVKSDFGISQPVAIIQTLKVRTTNSRFSAGQKQLANVLMFQERWSMSWLYLRLSADAPAETLQLTALGGQIWEDIWILRGSPLWLNIESFLRAIYYPKDMKVRSAKCVVWIKWDKTCSPSKWVEKSFDLWSHDWINWLATNYLSKFCRCVPSGFTLRCFHLSRSFGIPDQTQSDDRSETDWAAAKVTENGSKKGHKPTGWVEKGPAGFNHPS